MSRHIKKNKMIEKEEELDIYFYRIGWIMIGILIGAIFLRGIYGEAILNRIPKCFFHLVTGYYCPGCGGTRAVKKLLQGKILQSLFYHPFVGYVGVMGGWFMISQTIEHLSKERIRIALHFRQVYMWIGISLIIGNCLIKNGIKFFMGVSLMR